MLALLLATLLFTVPDSTQTYYAARDVDALEQHCGDASDRETALLCRYRLYPLTEDDAYLRDLPEHIEGATARELALLSGLWGYRAARSSLPGMIRYGRRSERLLKAAKALDPDEPFVLLIEGQSLIFRPAVVGGDDRAALDCFERLEALVHAAGDPAISDLEASLWRWYALDKMDDPRAAPLRERLLAQAPPPLYRQFLLDPP